MDSSTCHLTEDNLTKSISCYRVIPEPTTPAACAESRFHSHYWGGIHTDPSRSFLRRVCTHDSGSTLN